MGSLAVVPTDAPLVLGQRIFALRGRTGVLDNRYLRCVLEAPSVRMQLDQRSSGTTVTGIRQSELTRVRLPLPSVAVQRRIVDILEDHLSRLDAVKLELQAARIRLKAMRKSILLALIPEKERFPASWRQATVAEAGLIELGRQRHPDWHTGPNMRPYLRVANVFEDRFDLRDVKEMHWPEGVFERFKLHSGDVLLNEGQSPELVGRPALYRGTPKDVAFTNSLIRFQANADVLPEFALLVFRRHLHAGRFRSEARITTNIAHLSAARLKPIEFPIPSLQEQSRLVGLARERLDSGSRIEQQVAAVASREGALRRSLLDAAFSGRLTGRASDMDRVEEMADV